MRMRRSSRLTAVGVAVVLATGGATVAALSGGTAQAGTTSNVIAAAGDSTDGLPPCPFWAPDITPPARPDTPFIHPLQTAGAVDFSARAAAPTLTGTFQDGQVSLTVSRVPGAVAYRVWRDGVAVAWVSDWGQPTLTAVDHTPCKDSYYTVVAMVDNNATDASMGQMSVPYWLGRDGVVAPGTGPVPPGTTITMMVTSYNNLGSTATMYAAGLGICAVDPRVIPFGTYFTVSDYGTCFAGDIGTWIQNDTVDVWLPDSQAGGWGVQHRTITVIAGPGGGSTPTPTTSPSRTTSPSPTTSPTRTTSPSPSPTSTGQHPTWVPNHAYATGDLVSYAGLDYKCLQGHTSLVGWEPPNVPALWQLLS